jgi:hypothetical protein
MMEQRERHRVRLWKALLQSVGRPLVLLVEPSPRCKYGRLGAITEQVRLVIVGAVAERAHESGLREGLAGTLGLIVLVPHPVVHYLGDDRTPRGGASGAADAPKAPSDGHVTLAPALLLVRLRSVVGVAVGKVAPLPLGGDERCGPQLNKRRRGRREQSARHHRGGLPLPVEDRLGCPRVHVP